MKNSLKVVIGLIVLAIIGGLVFKAISIAIGFAIVAIIGYTVISFVYPKIMEKPGAESKEPMSPLEKYKDRT